MAAERQRVRHGDGSVVQLRVELEGMTTPVWRRLLVSSRATLLELHGVLQRSFGQDDSAPHQFVIDGISFFDPGGGDDPAHATDQNDLRWLALGHGSRLLHEVETGDLPWRLIVTVEQRLPRLVGQRLPWCIEGQGASPPDDCDGPARYRELLAALNAPLDPRAAELRQWLPEDFDPEFVDITAINAELGRLPRQRL